MALRDLFGGPTLDSLLGELGTLKDRLDAFAAQRDASSAEHAQTIADLQAEIESNNAESARAQRISQRAAEFLS